MLSLSAISEVTSKAYFRSMYPQRTPYPQAVFCVLLNRQVYAGALLSLQAFATRALAVIHRLVLADEVEINDLHARDSHARTPGRSALGRGVTSDSPWLAGLGFCLTFICAASPALRMGWDLAGYASPQSAMNEIILPEFV